jgi:Fe-S-cluster containining protein
MTERPVFQEEILQDYARLSIDDPITFCCERSLDCFNSCCRDVSIVLTPYDVLRMKRALGMDSGEFLEKYTFSPFSREQKIPAVLLRMEPESKRCLFVTEAGCGIYPHRPWACRMYPLGVAEPKNPNPKDRAFFFLLHEDICHGHGRGAGCTIREWTASQGIEQYEMMGASFKELMLHDFWDREEFLSPEKMEMYYMACFDLDRFRGFVFETRFLELFEMDEARVEAIRCDDGELLDMAMQWLHFSLFNEKTMKLRQWAVEARRKSARPPNQERPHPRR